MKCNNFLTGVAVGAVLGILFSPEKGSKLRGKIKDSFDDIKDQVDEFLGLKKDEFESLYAQLENKTEALTDETRSKLIQLLDSAKEKVKS